MSSLPTISIDALSEQAGMDVETIRAYERLGLLGKPRRLPGGLVLYRTDDVARVTFIRRAQELGFSLETIRQLFEITTDRAKSCADVHEVAERHLQDIRRRREDLMRMEAVLAPLVSACSRKGRVDDCPILNALSHPTV